MASLNSNSISGITTELFSNSHAVNKKYVDDNIPILPDSTIGGGKFLVTTDGVDITWSDISNVEEFANVGISTYYIPEMASSIHIEGVGGGAAGDNQGGSGNATDDNSRVLYHSCSNNGFLMDMITDTVYGGGKYLISGDCALLVSTDSFHWESKNIGQGSNEGDTSIRSVDYYNGLFLAGAMASYVCGSSNAVRASTDTIHWQARTISNSGNSDCFCKTGFGGLKYLNNKWFLLDATKRSMQISTDSIHWTLRTIPTGLSDPGGNKLHWSGNHYAYRSHCGIHVTSTDSIHWFKRTIPWGNVQCNTSRCFARPFTYSPTLNLWVNAYGTYNNQQCPAGSGQLYGQHLITSTDTIHWTLRTLAYAASRPEGYTACHQDYYTEVTEVNGKLYLSSCFIQDPDNFPNSQYCNTSTYFPLVSTDAIHWDGYIDAVGCNSLIIDDVYPGTACEACMKQFFNLNNRLLTGGYRIATVSQRLSLAGNGGNAGNYAKFSINPSKVIDRKLEINVGSGGATSTGTSCIGCVGAGTTISYRSQEGTTSYYFNGTDSQIELGNNDAFILGTGDFTLEFFVKFSSANGSPTSTDVIFDSLTTGSNGFKIVRYNVSDSNQNKIRFYTDGDYQATSDVVVENDTWVHVAVVRSGRTKIYVDGKEGEYPDTYIDSNNYSRPDFKLGVQRNTNSGFLHGYLSSIRLTKGHARYACLGASPASDFNSPPPDLNRSNRTVFLSGVGSTIADQIGNGVISNTNVSLCTSTCLPEIKINHTINGAGLVCNTQSCTMSPLKFNFGARGQDDPSSYTTQDFFNPFQPSGGGAGALTGETGGSSGALLNYSTEIKSTGGANPQSGISFQSAVYGTGGGGGNPGISGAPGFRGGGGGGAGEGSSACGGKGGDGFVKITWW